MQTNKLIPGTIYAYQKDQYSGGQAVLVLDNKLWTMGRSKGKFVVREADKGERPNDGGYRTNYRAVGVPVLKIDRNLVQWSESVQDEIRIMDSHTDILATAFKALGIERIGDMAGEFDNLDERHAQIVVTMGDGRKSTVTVTLATVRPQTITGEWDAYLAEKDRARMAQAAHQDSQQAEKSRRILVSTEVATRMDALLGEGGRNWRGLERQDCRRDDGAEFKVSEETLLRLLELAEKGAQR